MTNLLENIQVGNLSVQTKAPERVKLISVPLDDYGCSVTCAAPEAKADEFISKRNKIRKRKNIIALALALVSFATGAIVHRVKGDTISLICGLVGGVLAACGSVAIGENRMKKQAKNFIKENS